MEVIEYATAVGARDEVINWCRTALASTLKKIQPEQAEVEHIIDFLASDAAPKRLRKMSYDQAKAAADKWSTAQQKKGRDLIDGVDDLELIHDLGDGTRIVKLLTKKAYQREGFLMAQCVGGYNPDSSTIYSYRDANNMPHATFEVSRSNGEITQIKGKGNGPIHPRYIHPILSFLKAVGMEVRPSDMVNLGYYHVDHAAKKLMQKFVDARGRGPEFVEISGEEYICA